MKVEKLNDIKNNSKEIIFNSNSKIVFLVIVIGAMAHIKIV